jgi:hypothetical protein
MPDKNILDTALQRHSDAQSFWSEIYSRGEEDIEFLHGDQWDAKVRSSRIAGGRPCLQENRLLSMVHLICNQIRQASPSINVKPVDDLADSDTADIIDGVIRNIQHVSDCETVYDTAARNAISAGIGWIRVLTEHADYDSFDQEIKIDRILNPFSVLLDPNAMRVDGSDAEYGFILDEISKEEFERLYPDEDISSFDNANASNWIVGDNVIVAEYFYKEYTTKTLYQTDMGVFFKDDMPLGATVADERETDICTVKYAKLTHNAILEEGEFPGKYIPIVPVIGDEAFIDGRRQLYSMIYHAKDPQTYFNYMKSASAEILALQPKAPFVGPVGSFNSTTEDWITANVKNHAFLQYDVVYDKNGMPLPSPQRQPTPQGSPAMFQEMLSAADGIKSVLGIYDPSLGNASPDISGKAIIARQVQGDNSNFHFIDNLAVALRQVGRIIVGLIPYIYNTPRLIRILGEDKSDKLVPVNQAVVAQGSDYRKPRVNEPANKIIDLRAGKYDVIVEIGSAYSTRRQEAANAIIEIARVKPEILEVAGDILIDSLDVPNGQQLVKRIRSIMPPELLGDDVEAQRLQGLTQQLQELQQRLQQTESALLAKENNQRFENDISAQKLDIDRKKVEIEALRAMADIEKTKAETQNINAEMMSQISSSFANLQGDISDIRGAIEVMLDAAEADIGNEEQATGAPIEAPEIEETAQ